MNPLAWTVVAAAWQTAPLMVVACFIAETRKLFEPLAG